MILGIVSGMIAVLVLSLAAVNQLANKLRR